LSEIELSPQREQELRLLLSEWVKQNLAGNVVEIERQNRWRPAWYMKAEINGAVKSLYVRGERNFFLPWPLNHEMAVLKVLYDNGIPVPRVYGMCKNPKAIIMEAIDGSRDLSSLSEAQRVSIMDEYVDILRRIHHIDIKKFAAAGVGIPATPAEIALVFFGPSEQRFDETKVGPDSFVAFVRRWVHRHLPLHRNRVSFVTGDAGQFLVKDGRIASLIDFEISYVGDPLADMAGMRIRNLEEPFGDVEYVIRRYAKLTNEALDVDTINYYTIILACVTNLFIHSNLREDKADAIIWRAWEVKAARITLSAMADIHKIALSELEPPLPDREHHEPAYAGLINAISALPAPTPLDQYNRTNAIALAQHLRDVNRIGLSMDEDELDDLATLIGHRPRSIGSAEGELEAYVSAAGLEDELKIIGFFNRRYQRRRLALLAHDERLQLYDLEPLSKIL
jgi:aminoglycoside phosphotransferase (APT) family kinase protein